MKAKTVMLIPVAVVNVMLMIGMLSHLVRPSFGFVSVSHSNAAGRADLRTDSSLWTLYAVQQHGRGRCLHGTR